MDVTSLFIVCNFLAQTPAVPPATPFDRGAGGYALPPAAATALPAGYPAGPYAPPPTGAATLAPPAVPTGVLTSGSSPPPGTPGGVSRAASPPQALAPTAGVPLSTGPAPAAATGAAPRPGSEPANVQPPPDQTPAGELIRAALTPPKSLGLVGRKTALVEIVGRLGDRRRQIDAVRAYWRVAAETAEYHYAWQHVQFLQSLNEAVRGIEQGPALQTAEAEIGARFASAEARRREQGLRLANAQFDLAETAMFAAAGAATPLSDDLPHVGTYHTYFDKVYHAGSAPSRMHLLNRTIPARHEVVGARAATVLALQDAYDAAFDAYRRRQLPLDEVLETVEALRTGRSEFVTAVRRYNEEIAEYALASAPEGTSRETLVGMLVKTAHTPVPGRVSRLNEGDAIETVTFLDESGAPIVGSASTPVRHYDVAPIPDAAISGPAPAGFAMPQSPAGIAPTAAGGPSYAAPPGYAPSGNTVPANAVPAGFAAPRSAVPPPTNALPAGPYGPPAGASSYAPPASDGLRPTLAPPLIATSDPEVRPTSFDDRPTSPAASEPARFEPATSTQPLNPFPDAATTPAATGGGSSIQFAPLPAATPATKANQPTLAPPLQLPQNPSPPANPYRTNRVPLDDGPTEGTNPMSSGLPVESRWQVPPAVEPIIDREVAPVAYYAQLQNTPPARRAQDLVETLYGAKAASGESTRPITLEECLAAAPHRRRAVAAYWQTAEQDVRRRIAFQTLEELETLQQIVLRFRDTPAGAIAMLRVEAAKLSAHAVRLESAAEWVAACGRLTAELDRPLGEPWLTAATLPHAGSYTASAGKTNAADTQVRRAADRIPAIHEVLQLRAQSVVAADAAVDFVLREYAEGRGTINGVLHAVARRQTETGDLSTVVTRYNLDIADYALALLPAETPRDTVVAALVVRDATARR